MEQVINLSVYAVRNKEGKFFKSKGSYDIYVNWVDDINKAKIFIKTGGARTLMTWFAEKHGIDNLPELLKLSVTGIEVMDEASRIEKTIKKKSESQAKHLKTFAEMRLKNAQRDFDKAQAELKKLKGV